MTTRLRIQTRVRRDLEVEDPIRLEPARQRISVSDGALQMEMNLTGKRVREKLADDYRKEQEHIAHFLRRLSAPLLMVSNQGDVVEQVRSLLGVPRRAN